MKQLFFLFLFTSLLAGCTIGSETETKEITTEKKEVITVQTLVPDKQKTPPVSPPSTSEQELPPTALKKYNVFSGSYTNIAGAQEKVRLLENNQIKGTVVEAYVHGKKWYRVYVGSFTSEGEAQQYRNFVNSLRVNRVADTFVMHESPPAAQFTPSLPNRSLQPSPVKNVYHVYSGSYQNKSNAQQKLELLSNKQINGTIVEAYVRGKKWYRVHIGSFYDKESAQQYVNRCKYLGFSDTFMIGE